MSIDFRKTGIVWSGRGYFGAPPASADGRERPGDAWETWCRALDQARKGDFALLPRLVDIYRTTASPVQQGQCVLLLGDAGTDACIEPFRSALPEVSYLEIALDHVKIVAARGLLADVPLLLDTFARFADQADSVYIAYLLADLLEEGFQVVYDPEQFDSPAAYVAAVRAIFADLVARLGSEKVPVFQGDRLNVEKLARGLIQAVQGDHFIPGLWRRKFEATTGIDCTAFYREGRLQPLSATALVEEFLESPDVAKFQDGVRYFFGHRIPD